MSFAICKSRKTRINKVYLAPQKEDIDFTYDNGYISVKLAKIECHQMVVFE